MALGGAAPRGPAALLALLAFLLQHGLPLGARLNLDAATEDLGGSGEAVEEQAEGQFLPDEQLYKNLAHFQVTGLSEKHQDIVHDRIARCYEPRPDRNYKDVRWGPALDAYMKKYVKPGLDRWSRAIIYDMPHVWGKHWWTEYFPHHWMAAVVPDVKASPSTHCLSFNYSQEDVASDPAGCLFFKKSFEPTQALTRCVRGVLESSSSWQQRQRLMRARGPLYRAKLDVSAVPAPADADPAELTSIEATHASWNSDNDAVPRLFNYSVLCSSMSFMQSFTKPKCPKGTTYIRTLKTCKSRNSKGSHEMECEYRIQGDDVSLADFLQGRGIVPAGAACNSSTVPELVPGAVALLEPAECPVEDRIKALLEAGAGAIMAGVDVKRAHFGDRVPVPAFWVSENTASKLVRLLEDARKEGTGGTAALWVHGYRPVMPEAADGIPGFQEEVSTWLKEEGQEQVAWLSTRDRTYELLKSVARVDLSNLGIADARRAVAEAAQATLTQPRRSKIAALDPHSESQILSCYGLEEPPTEDVEEEATDTILPQEGATPRPGGAAVPEQALLTHEASRCLPLMWDKLEVPGPPYPQVWEASGSFPGDNLREVDELKVHPLCSRLGLALNHWEMFGAPYPDPNEWEPGSKFKLSTGLDAFHKGSPRWIAKHFMDYCLNPDTAVCTSFTVCWAALTRHVTRLVHPYCDEAARPFPEMPILDG